MQPRSYFGTFCIIFPVFTLIFVIVFAISGVLLTETSIQANMNIVKSIILSLLLGLIMAARMKRETISVTFQDKQTFLERLNIRLAEIGYHPKIQTETFLTFKPSFRGGLLAVKVSVQVESNSVTIVGPKMLLKKLQKRLSK